MTDVTEPEPALPVGMLPQIGKQDTQLQPVTDETLDQHAPVHAGFPHEHEQPHVFVAQLQLDAPVDE